MNCYSFLNDPSIHSLKKHIIKTNHTSKSEKGLQGSAESQSWAKLSIWQKFILLTNPFIYK